MGRTLFFYKEVNNNCPLPNNNKKKKKLKHWLLQNSLVKNEDFFIFSDGFSCFWMYSNDNASTITR